MMNNEGSEYCDNVDLETSLLGGLIASEVRVKSG